MWSLMGSGRCGGVSVVPPSTRASYTWTTLRQLAHVHNRSTTEGTEHVREAGRSKNTLCRSHAVSDHRYRPESEKAPTARRISVSFFFFFLLRQERLQKESTISISDDCSRKLFIFFILFGWPHLCVSNFVIVTSTGTFDWMFFFFFGSEFIIRKYKAKTVKIPLFNKKRNFDTPYAKQLSKYLCPH